MKNNASRNNICSFDDGFGYEAISVLAVQNINLLFHTSSYNLRSMGFTNVTTTASNPYCGVQVSKLLINMEGLYTEHGFSLPCCITDNDDISVCRSHATVYTLIIFWT